MVFANPIAGFNEGNWKGGMKESLDVFKFLAYSYFPNKE